MQIFVCLKEVPARDSRYQIDPAERWIEESSVSFEINECDEYALEEALRLKEAHGGEVTLLTLGGARAEKAMRKGLAMGADEGILIVDERKGARDPLTTSHLLAAALEDQEYDLILTGTQSDDLGYAQTGVMLADQLDIPHATIVMEIEVDLAAQCTKILREMESGWFQRLETSLPALLTIQAGISAIRYPSLKGIMQAKKKQIRKIPASDLEVDESKISALEMTRLYVPEQENKAELLEGGAREAVDSLLEKLRDEARVL